VTIVITPQHRRRWPLAAPLLPVLVALNACTGDGDPDVVPSTSIEATTTTIFERPNDGTLVIGIYLPQTGPGAALGEPMIDAVRSSIDEINAAGGVLGEDVELKILDEGAATGRATGPTPLITDGVDAIVGPASSLNALLQLASIVRTENPVVACSPTATALALDDYPDGGYFFRTVPSDSLQMVAIARRAERSGVTSVAVGYLDDPYGRGLADAVVDEIVGRRRQRVVSQVPFSADEENLSGVAAELIAEDPGLVIVLGDTDDGGRLLSALDAATVDDPMPVIVNDAIRTASAIPQLSPEFRLGLSAVAPVATSSDERATGFFTPHAIDCVNLIALATVVAGSDDPDDIKNWMAGVSGGGRQCTSFAACDILLGQNLQIDYNGLSGNIELSTTTGDPTRAQFRQFGFDTDGSEVDVGVFEVP
jgi:branched-chain amino acid transport system substrate-binding protein